TDLVLLGYPLDKNSLIKDVCYFDGGEIFEFDFRNFKLSKKNTIALDLSFESKYKSRAHFVSEIRDRLLTAVKEVAESAQRMDKKMLCDLSGGFDTRTVFGAFQVLGAEVKYVTNNILGNESEIALALLHHFQHENFEVIDDSLSKENPA